MDISGTSSQDTADLISDLNVSDWEHVDQRSVDQKTNVGPSGWYSAGNETNLGTSCWGSPDHGTVVEPSGWGMANQGPTLDQPLPSRWGSVDQQANMSPSVLGASGWESADNSTGMCTSDSMDEDVDEDCPRMYEECNGMFTLFYLAYMSTFSLHWFHIVQYIVRNIPHPLKLLILRKLAGKGCLVYMPMHDVSGIKEQL